MVDQLLQALPPLPWIILFSPLVAAMLICFLGLKSPKFAVVVSLSGILLSLAGSVTLFQLHRTGASLPVETIYSWVRFADVNIQFGFLIDRLSLLMLLVV